MDDTNTEHPAFHSDAETPNGILERVTLFSYIKFKIRLYTIASPIVGDIYFHRASSISTLRLKVQKIDNELSAWLQGLPPELRLDRLIDAASSPGWKSTADTFAMQAMALQVAYDNILILLHRPLLPHTLSSPTNGAVDAAPESTSQDRCWESAMRTSNLGKYQNYIELARQTHAAAFLGINLFTAGMVLSIVALSKPLSEQAQSAKHAIGRVLSLSRALQNRALLASQTSKVLIDLVRLILDKEMKAIMGQADRQAIGAVEGLTQNTVHPADRSNMVDAHLSWNGASMAGPTDDERVNSGHGLEPAEPILADTMQQEDPQQSSILSTFDLQHGLQSLQQGTRSSADLTRHNTDSLISDISIFRASTWLQHGRQLRTNAAKRQRWWIGTARYCATRYKYQQPGHVRAKLALGAGPMAGFWRAINHTNYNSNYWSTTPKHGFIPGPDHSCGNKS